MAMKKMFCAAQVGCSLLSLAFAAEPEVATRLGKPVETDPESGARVYLLGADERPADNIYGEQPYSDPTGQWIAVRYDAKGDRPGGLGIVGLTDGVCREVLSGRPPFPAFHAWGEHLYYNQKVEGQLRLRRCRYATLEVEDVAALPAEKGSYSYGTVSPDGRYYAVCVQDKKDEPSKVHLLDLQTGQWRLLLDKPGYHAKHEQFSRDGRNRVLIQLNQLPKVKQVLLGELDLAGPARLFPADRPHTPRPTGHEAWIGTSGRIFFSTGSDPDSAGNVWSAKADDKAPVLAFSGKQRFGHVSVSRCGRYWIGDTGEKGIPLYVGSFASGACRRAVFSRTVHDGQQKTHTHPYLTADNRWLIFTSSRDGHAQVYGAKLPPGWLDSL